MPAILISSHVLKRLAALLLVLPLLAIAGSARASAPEAGEPAPAALYSDIHENTGAVPGRPASGSASRTGTHLQRPLALQEPSATPTPIPAPSDTPEPKPQRRPTRTPGPTSTPLTIPPPQDPGTTQMMLAFGLLVVLVILFGVWLNRSRASN